jgi:PAS domain-containing protein
VITCPWRCTSAGHAATPLLVVTLRDLTELEAGRAARFEAEAKYRALVEHIHAVVYLDPVDESSESIYVSPQVVELLGISQDDWAERPVRVAAPRAPRGHRPRLGGVPVCVQRARATQPRVPDGP